MLILPYKDMPAEFRPYSSRFPKVAAMLSAAIEQATPGVVVEHIGSTSVPGCGGKGVLDLAVQYPEGSIERVKQALTELGFQPQGGPEPFPESRPMRVGSVAYEGQEFRIHAHVIEQTSEEACELTWFRDLLCTDLQLRQRYEANKQAVLASGISDSIEYCKAKGGFITEVLNLRRD